MKQGHLKIAATAFLLGLAVEAFYEHPTYGRGIQAFLTAIRLGELL